MWNKLGKIFEPDQNYPWMHSHAANTVAECIEGDLFRVYFSCRDKDNRAHIGALEFEMTAPYKVTKIYDEPILTPGSVGLFDDSGISLSCIQTIGGKKCMYYLGWNLGATVPWRNSIGLAVFNEGSQKFEKYSPAPIVDRNHADPYSVSYPFVLEDEGKYKMWYGSNLDWGADQKDMKHLIKYAESNDGINWNREGVIAIPFKDDTEYAMSRPYVIKEEGIYKMWYSYRGASYRIGYAESGNGIEWERKDHEVGIAPSESGWDSETVEYPFIFEHKGKRYMLYNGNQYGKTGFGLAVWE